MTYTTRSWDYFIKRIEELHEQGTPASEIAEELNTRTDLIEAVIQKYLKMDYHEN